MWAWHSRTLFIYYRHFWLAGIPFSFFSYYFSLRFWLVYHFHFVDTSFFLKNLIGSVLLSGYLSFSVLLIILGTDLMFIINSVFLNKVWRASFFIYILSWFICLATIPKESENIAKSSGNARQLIARFMLLQPSLVLFSTLHCSILCITRG